MEKKKTPAKRRASLGRSVTVTVRLDPKLRYLAELAARQQRRTVSSFIEWAIEASLSKVEIAEKTSIASKAEDLWDVLHPDRFVNLADKYGHLLNHEEQILWKLIEECGPLWKPDDQFDPMYRHFPAMGMLDIPLLRKHWDKFLSVARGEASADILPHHGSHD